MAEEIEEQQNQETNEKIVVEKKSRAGLWFSIIITLCLAILAGAGFYLLQQLREHQDNLSSQDNQKLIEMSKQINNFQSQVAAMHTQIATLEADITSKQQHFNKALADFSELQQEKLELTRKELQESINRLQRQLGKTRGDWLIADAEYLLSVANQRLHLVGDINTTREALEAADQRLRESGDAAVYPVRAQIAKELAELNNVQVPDIVGLYAQIQTLKDRINKLAVLLPYAGKKLTKSDSIHTHSSPTADEHGVLSSVLGQLDDYIVVRHSDKPVSEILTPEQAEFIREQLAVKLEMIKIALVEHNDALFKAAIADAKKWLVDNFTQNQEAKKMVAELDTLANVSIRGHYPDISQSLKMLRDITRLRLEGDKAMSSEPEPAVNNIQAVEETPTLAE